MKPPGHEALMLEPKVLVLNAGYEPSQLAIHLGSKGLHIRAMDNDRRCRFMDTASQFEGSRHRHYVTTVLGNYHNLDGIVNVE